MTTTTEAAPATTAAPLEAAAGSSLRRIQAAMQQTSESPSVRMEGLINMSGAEGLDGDFSMSFAAAYDAATGNSSVTMDLSSMADLISAQAASESEEDEFGAAFLELFIGMFTKFEVRQIGDTVYMNNPFIASMSGSETTWIASPIDPGTDTTGEFLNGSPTTPGELFEPFLEGGGEVLELGTETLHGVETTHYLIEFDREALIQAASEADRAEVEEELALYNDEIKAEIWATDEYIYRFKVDIDGAGIEAPEGESFDRMTMVFDMWDYGTSINIEPPPADELTFVDEASGFSFGG